MTQTAQTKRAHTTRDQASLSAPVPEETRGQRGRRMIAEMSNVRTLQWIGIALALHIVVIGVVSHDFIRQCIQQWTFSPKDDTAGQGKTDSKKDITGGSTGTAANTTSATAGATPTAVAPAAAATSAKHEMSDDEKHLAELKKNGNPEAKKLTETAAPTELPKGPAHGFKISEDP